MIHPPAAGTRGPAPRAVVLLTPGRLDTRTGGSIYNRRIAEGLRALGWPIDVVELDPAFPHPTAAALEASGRALASLPDDTIALVDSLALGPMADAIVQESPRLAIVALVHLPLAASLDLDPASAASAETGERRALSSSALVVVTGRAAIPLLDRYHVPHDRIVVVEPGTDRPGEPSADPRAGPARQGDTSEAPVHLLAVGTINRTKGHDVLLEALAVLPVRTWHLTCAGSLTRDPSTAARVRAVAAALGIAARVTFAGDLDAEALERCYRRSDIFVLATRQETYGMAVAEALAHGLPVIATATGAIPEMVGDTGGVIVPPGDAAALAGAIGRVLADPALRARLAEGARGRAARLPSWTQAADAMAAALARAAAVRLRG